MAVKNISVAKGAGTYKVKTTKTGIKFKNTVFENGKRVLAITGYGTLRKARRAASSQRRSLKSR